MFDCTGLGHLAHTFLKGFCPCQKNDAQCAISKFDMAFF